MTRPERGDDDLGNAVLGDAEPTVVDARGRRCPLPVIDLARTIPTVALGALVDVLADDPAADTDIAAWCRMRGHEYLGSSALISDVGGSRTGELETGGSGGSPARAYRVRRRS